MKTLNFKEVLETLTGITKDWSDLDKVENDLKIIKSSMRGMVLTEEMWNLYDNVVSQLDLLNSPEYGDFDGRIFRFIFNDFYEIFKIIGECNENI